MDDGDSYRKAAIGTKLTKLFTDNPEYSVVQHLYSIMRTKNLRGENKDVYEMTDDNFLIALESTIKELRQNEE